MAYGVKGLYHITSADAYLQKVPTYPTETLNILKFERYEDGQTDMQTMVKKYAPY